MNIKFVDLDNSLAFDGSKPYIHWFDEGQSTNINYVKRLVVCSQSPNLTVTIEDDSPFYVVDNIGLLSAPNEEINGFQYKDIENYKKKSLVISPIQHQVSGYYVFLIYIMAYSNDAGEFIGNFYISDSTDEEEFSIGADFYNENELLVSNLENKGIEIPQQIQKAIYESNVHEEAMDNILMNRKWKELLIEYWNIVAKKGSYKSLIDSLKWFEYGDHVKLYEFWKETYNKDLYISNNIEAIINDMFRKQLSVISKTTYIGIYFALNHYNITDSGSGYEEGSGSGFVPEDNPALMDYEDLKWPAEELSLKMTLLGNFYATYFMPIHLDLIHSTVEKIVFTNTLKIMNHPGLSRRDYFDLGGTFRTSVKMDGNYYIAPHKVYIYPDTILSLTDYDIADGSGTQPLNINYNTLGVETSPRDFAFSPSEGDAFTINDIILAANCISTRYGALVPIDVLIDGNIDDGDWIKSAQIHIVKDNEEMFDYNHSGFIISPNQVTDEDGKPKYEYRFTFNLLFEKAGDYHFFVTFETNTSYTYSHEFLIHSIDDADCTIHIYKVERKEYNKYKDWDFEWDDDGMLKFIAPSTHTSSYDCILSELLYDIGNSSTGANSNSGSGFELELDNFSMTIKEKNIPSVNVKYIAGSLENFSNRVGLNHVIMYNSDDCDNLTLTLGDISISATPDLDTLKEKFPDYWWGKRTTLTEIEYESGSGSGLVGTESESVIGIRKAFTINSIINTLYDKEFKAKDCTWRVCLYQTSTFGYCEVYRNSLLYSMKVMPLERYMTIDVGGHQLDIEIQYDKNYFYNDKGLYENRIKVTGYAQHYVDEELFIPMLHTLKDINEDNCEMHFTEMCVAIPEFNMTKGEPEDIAWEFRNVSKGKICTMNDGLYEDGITIKSVKNPIDSVSPLVSHLHPSILEPGYYDIVLNYKYGESWLQENRNSAFRINKKTWNA